MLEGQRERKGYVLDGERVWDREREREREREQ